MVCTKVPGCIDFIHILEVIKTVSNVPVSLCHGLMTLHLQKCFDIQLGDTFMLRLRAKSLKQGLLLKF